MLTSVAALALNSLAVAPHLVDNSSAQAGSDIALVRSRYVASVLPSASDDAYLRAQAAGNAASLRPDGSWPDIDYSATARSRWVTADHLDRVLVMAKAARADRDAGHPNIELEACVLLGLKWWDEHDYRNPNWWWNEIGVPQLMGEIGNLMLDQIPSAERERMVAIMMRSDWHRWTGANLTWGTGIEVARGCMENDSAAVAEGFSHMFAEIKIVSQPQDGIQQDDSFHQHGQQLYNGGYGLDYANDLSRFISYSWGTQFQIPADKMAIFSAYLLDGQQWFLRQGGFDYSVMGREITRAVPEPGPGDRTGGPISPVGVAYRMGKVLALLAAEPTPQQQELQAFVDRLEDKPDARPFIGNKQFWCSDYMAQRRAGYFTSVKMLSTRMLNGELVNSEGKKSVHLSDGVNFLYLTGDEYRNIFPVWDWTKLPGTTAIQGTLIPGERNSIHARGSTSFDGGVSDGAYGAAAMDLERGGLSAMKAWFFFDDSYVALGAGISLANDTQHSVATDVNQPLLRGDVLTSENAGPLPQGTHTYQSAHRVWVYHDHVGYVFAPHTRLVVTAGPQTGAWSDIGTGSTAPLTEQVFNLWIDHGTAPTNGSYAYVVLPNVTPKQMAEKAKTADLRILENSRNTQAVYNRALKLAEIAFRRAGSLSTPLGRVTADHACLLLVRKTAEGWKLSASNPENLPLTLHVTVKHKRTEIQLPGGNFAGSTVSADLH